MDMQHTSRPPLLEISDLGVAFHQHGRLVPAVTGLSLRLEAGQTLAVVGESGCGKSLTALAIMGLLPRPAAVVTSGAIRLDGQDLLALRERDMRRIRGNRIGMVFQEPMTSLNPVMTVGRQVEETLVLHQGLSHRQARQGALDMLRLVRIAEPQRRIDEYPHQLSGGMRQRVMIALALACRPRVLIADEPTTALDVTVQAQILSLLRELQAQLGMGVILITHDLGVVAETCDRVAVMYAGRKVEEADTRRLFASPGHPYTRALMASMPSMAGSGRRLAEIGGMVPALGAMPAGCAFAPRCSRAGERCRVEVPQMSGGPTRVACFDPFVASSMTLEQA